MRTSCRRFHIGIDGQAIMAPLPLAPAQPHVPAWKKLGLKLKYATDEPSTSPGTLQVTASTNDRKCQRADSGSLVAPPILDGIKAKTSGKKRKLRDKSDPAPAWTGKQSDSSPQPSFPISTEATKLKSSLPPPPPTTPGLKARKSVSFTPETKTEDGDSTRELFMQWVSEQKTADPSFEVPEYIPPPTLLSETSAEPSPSNQSEQSSKVNKLKRPNARAKTESRGKDKLNRNSQRSTGNPRISVALEYLTAFTTSPSNWKFSKNHQKYLWKHLFDLDAIPSSYDFDLYKYLLGLKGTSSRQRLRSTALQKREENEMWLSDLLDAEIGDDARGRKRKREEYDNAWKREKARLEDHENAKEEHDKVMKKWEFRGQQYTDWEKKVMYRRRAETVLWAIGEKEPIDLISEGEEVVANGNTFNGSAVVDAKANGCRLMANQNNGKRKRKRKRRTTGVPDDESSSSSSSSEPSSDEEGHKAKTIMMKALSSNAEAKNSGSEVTSSDSESESGSESD